ncbi:MAG: bifunctional riboflavin kinase/FAD synthetase [Bacteroidales bacterium]|nr:bifunctional riboflavin kinase/FAD synthetase [Bacteroidales bacterium]MBQ6100659.1 bifunctional riboflavin kinase/FAD synthetase [Bacteroidales bacterium]
MRIINNSIQARNIKNAVVTIGTFDGVHLGHQAIFKEMRRLADEVNGETVVVTFHPHPRQVLAIGTEKLRFICSQEEKLKKFEEFGIDNVVIIPFTKEFASTPSDEFIKDYIIERIHPAVIVVGYDHHFGKNRMGDFQMLNELGAQYGFKTVQVEAQDINEVAVSSTKIRNFLWTGNVKAANELLGYPYSVTGLVIRGNEIGRTIGFPTANLDIPNEFMMINNPGVYACRTEINGNCYDAMANTGTRPTIGDRADGDFIIEVNVFDFEEDLYGKTLKVWFIDRIRDEVKFNGLEALKNQLHQDREKAKKILSLSQQ